MNKTKSMKLVFIDESGDPGFDIEHGASSYFAIGVVVFPSYADAQCMEREITLLKENLGIRGELKFSKSSHERRIAYLQAINKCNFYAKVLFVDKNKITSQELKTKPARFYNFFLKQVVKHSQIKQAKITLDGKSNKAFILELKTYLRKSADFSGEFVMKDSKKDVLVQVADSITSAVAWDRKNAKNTYHSLIAESKLNIWDFKKKPLLSNPDRVLGEPYGTR